MQEGVKSVPCFADGVPLGPLPACVLVDAYTWLGPIGEAGTDGLQHLGIGQLASVLPTVDAYGGQDEHLQQGDSQIHSSR